MKVYELVQDLIKPDFCLPVIENSHFDGKKSSVGNELKLCKTYL